MKKLSEIFALMLGLVVIAGGMYVIYLSYDNLPEFSGESNLKPPAPVDVVTDLEPADTSEPYRGQKIETVPADSAALGDSLKQYAYQAEEEAASEKRTLSIEEFNPNIYFTGVAKYSIPRVVRIIATQKNSSESFHWNPFRGDDEDEGFNRGIGSGAVISEDGLIVTNNHVVDNSKKIVVTFSDNSEMEAEIIGQDPMTDLALIKVKPEKPLPFFNIHPKDDLQIGEWVMAVGSPLNLTSSVTVGIISALSRNINIIPGSYGVESFIQTDAVINPGNSGGPLVNLKGEIVGINTAIASRTGYYQSFGFAIPVSILRKVIHDLQKFGKVRRGFLGISLLPLSREKAKEAGLDKPNGVLVAGVQPGMPAEKAGLREGDIIVQINDRKVNAPNELQTTVLQYDPGEEINVTFIRNGKTRRISVPLKEIEIPVAERETRNRPEQPVSLELKDLGLMVRNLSTDEYKSYNTVYGIIIEKSENQEKFPEKSVILEINGHHVFSVDRFKRLYDNFKKDSDSLTFVLKMKVEEGFLEKEIVLDEN
ncbi:MAG: hypothetical protein Kow00108_15140 [Calditrichia bacterium]